MAMSSPAVTNFALNFDENVRWAMCLRLKPDVLAAIQAAGPDASNIRFAVEGDRHVRGHIPKQCAPCVLICSHDIRVVYIRTRAVQAIEVGDKKFVLDCREEKTGATICEAHKDWSRGEVTEVGVAKLRGDVQVCSAVVLSPTKAGIKDGVAVKITKYQPICINSVVHADDVFGKADACHLQAKPERHRPARQDCRRLLHKDPAGEKDTIIGRYP